MSGLPLNDAKERIRAAVDIVDLVGRSLRLERRGRLWLGLCPWHDDSRPSLQVNPERQTWRCWVCNVGGDVFSFVMRREGVEFREALQMLAEEAGVRLTVRGGGVQPGSPNDKQSLYKAMAWAEEQYHRALLTSADAAPARRYLEERHIDQASIARYRLGFAPENWQWLIDRARSTNFSPDVLRAAGLIRRSERSSQDYDYFRGRLMFPVHDSQGRAIAFGGRVIPGVGDPNQPKYVNSPETRLFTKSEHLYGLDVVRESVRRGGTVVVMEGYTDVILARQYDFDNVTAVLGTALTADHLRLLRRFADRVVLLLDGDAAGQKRTSEVLQLFVAAQMDVRIATLPEGFDPADLLVAHGAAAMQAVLDEAVDALQYKIDLLTNGLDPLTDLHRANEALEELLRTIAAAPAWDLTSPEALRLREQQVLAQLARRFMIDGAELRARLAALRQKRPRSAVQRESADPQSRPVLHGWERTLFEFLARYPERITHVLERIGADDLFTPAGRELLRVYQQLEAEGRQPLCEVVMTELEDLQLKGLLAELEDQAQLKEGVDWEESLNELFDAFRRRNQEASCRKWEGALQENRLSENEQIELLRSLIHEQRVRQGLSAPTDG